MDVRYLSLFVKDNKARLSEEILLASTNVIICSGDFASELYRWMCRDEKLPPDCCSGSFCPNLVAYAKVVEEFFHLLKECRIKPIIFEVESLKGTQRKKEYHQASAKRYMWLESDRRSRRADKKTKLLARTAYQANIDIDTVELSPLIHTTFKQVIKKLAIEIRHPNEKYRFEIIKLANEMDCPVLTLCSDYLMYPMSKGFIRLDLDFFDGQNIVLDDMNNKCIRCYLFSQRKLLLAVPGLQSKSVPFLAVLMEFRFFHCRPIKETFTSLWRNNETRMEHNNLNKNKVLGGFLEWMRGKSWDELIRIICELVRLQDGRVGLVKRLNEELTVVMRQKLDDGIGLDHKSFLESYYMEYNDSAGPAVDYLVGLVETLKLDAFVLYIMTSRRIYYDRIYLNDLNQQSTNCLKIRPYSVVLCLLRPTTLMEAPSKSNSIWVYDRLEDNQYGRRVVKQARELEGFGSLDHLHVNSLVDLSDDNKKKLLLSTFRVKSDQFGGEASLKNPDLINEIRLCLIIVKYINEESKHGDHKTAPLDRSFVTALILTCLFYTTSRFVQPPSGLPDEDIQLLRRELEAVKGTPNVYDNPEMYWAIVHQMSSIECAIDAFCMLNSLLGQVFPQPQLEVWFDGPLIFKLARMIKTSQTDELTCLNLPILIRIVGDLLTES